MQYNIIPESYIGLTCDLADHIMQQKLGKDYEKYITESDSEVMYTEQGQNIFEEILGEVEGLFSTYKIENEARA